MGPRSLDGTRLGGLERFWKYTLSTNHVINRDHGNQLVDDKKTRPVTNIGGKSFLGT